MQAVAVIYLEGARSPEVFFIESFHVDAITFFSSFPMNNDLCQPLLPQVLELLLPSQYLKSVVTTVLITKV